MSETLATESPDVVGISMRWGSLKAAKVLAAKMKSLEHPPLLVLGNIMATFAGRQLLREPEFKGAIAVEGEGEEALRLITERASGALLVNDTDFYKGIPNVRTSSEGEILRRALDLSVYPDIDEIAAPELYADDWSYGLELSRGCPWSHCTFCSIAESYITDGQAPERREFPLEVIIARMERLMRMREGQKGNNMFWSNDSEFLGDMRKDRFQESLRRACRVIDVFEDLGRRMNNRISVTAFSGRVDSIFRQGEDSRNIDRLALYRRLLAAGFRKVYIGIESGSPSQLKLYNKGVSVEENEEAIRIMKEDVGMHFEPGFIFMGPTDTLNTLRENMAFIERTRLFEADSRIFGSLRAQAGSPLSRYLISKGFVSGRLDMDSLEYPVLHYADASVGRIAEAFSAFQNQSADLARYMNSRLYWKGSNDENMLVKLLIDMIYVLEMAFLKDCIKAGGDPEVIRNIMRSYLKRFRAILRDIRTALRSGKIRDAEYNRLPYLLDEADENSGKLL